MKRIAIILAGLAMALGLVSLTAGPSSAEGACAYSLPPTSDECISQELYEYVTGLQGQLVSARTAASDYLNYSTQLRGLLDQASIDVLAARQAASMAETERDQALSQVDVLTHRVIVQRATIKRLRDRLHAVI